MLDWFGDGRRCTQGGRRAGGLGLPACRDSADQQRRGQTERAIPHQSAFVEWGRSVTGSPWLARLKNARAPEMAPTEPTKPPVRDEAAGFVGFAGAESVAIPKTSAVDREGTELRDQYAHAREACGFGSGLFAARVQRFMDRGITLEAAEALADRLAMRDADLDDRRLCLECTYLGASGRCVAAATGRLPGAATRLEPLQTILQRCEAFGLRKGL